MKNQNSSKTSVLIVSAYFEPYISGGGPVQSLKSLVNLLHGNKFVFNIFTELRSNEFGRSAFFSRNMSYGMVFYFSRFLGSIAYFFKLLFSSADVLYLNSLFSFKFSFLPLIFSCINPRIKRVVLAPRGELYTGALQKSRLKKTIFIWCWSLFISKRYVTFHATSNQEVETIQRYFGKWRCLVAGNIPDLDLLNDKTNNKCSKKDVYSISSDRLKILWYGRIVPKKNLNFIFEVLTSVSRDVHLTVLGPVEDQVYFSECLAGLSKCGQNITCDFLGDYSRNELLVALSQSHVCCFPTFGENFGHVIWESLACGVPVAISEYTPWKCDRPALNVLSINSRSEWVDFIQTFDISFHTSAIVRKEAVDRAKNYISFGFDGDSLLSQNINIFASSRGECHGPI